MLRSIKDIHDYEMTARDGNVGRTETLLFDDQSWRVQYVVADTGGWLSDEHVVLKPDLLQAPDGEKRSIGINLTKAAVERSPSIDTHRPVSQQQVSDPIRWPSVWAMEGMYVGLAVIPEVKRADEARKAREIETAVVNGDPHLRSTKEVIGYHIHALNGDIGHVEDFILDDEQWTIRYLAIDTRNWLPGRKVLVAPQWTEEIDWMDQEISVNLTRESIEKSPSYNPSAPVNRQYEEELYDYYGRQVYWEEPL